MVFNKRRDKRGYEVMFCEYKHVRNSRDKRACIMLDFFFFFVLKKKKGLSNKKILISALGKRNNCKYKFAQKNSEWANN